MYFVHATEFCLVFICCMLLFNWVVMRFGSLKMLYKYPIIILLLVGYFYSAISHRQRWAHRALLYYIFIILSLLLLSSLWLWWWWWLLSLLMKRSPGCKRSCGHLNCNVTLVFRSEGTTTLWSRSGHRFPAPSSKLCRIWLRHWRGTLFGWLSFALRAQKP